MKIKIWVIYHSWCDKHGTHEDFDRTVYYDSESCMDAVRKYRLDDNIVFADWEEFEVDVEG